MWSPIRQLVEAGVLVRGGVDTKKDTDKATGLVRREGETPEEFELRVSDELVSSANAALYQFQAGLVSKSTLISLRARALTLAREALLTFRRQGSGATTAAADSFPLPASVFDKERALWPRLYKNALIRTGFTGEELAKEVENAPTYDVGTSGLTAEGEQRIRTEADRRYASFRKAFLDEATLKKIAPDDAASLHALWVETVSDATSDLGIRRNLLARGAPSYTPEAVDTESDQIARAQAEANLALTEARLADALKQLNTEGYFVDDATKTAFKAINDARKELINKPNFVALFKERFNGFIASLGEDGKKQLREIFGSGGGPSVETPAAPVVVPAADTSGGSAGSTYVPTGTGGAVVARTGDGEPASSVVGGRRTSTTASGTGSSGTWTPFGSPGSTDLMTEYQRIMARIAQGTLDLNQAKQEWAQRKEAWNQERLIRLDQRSNEEFEKQLAISQRTLRLQRDKARLEAGVQQQVAVNQATLGAMPYLAPRTEFLPGQEPGGAMQRLSEFSGAEYTPVRTADVTHTFDPDAIAEQALREFDARSSDIGVE